MKALTIHPLPVEQMTCGQKTIEVRTWATNYRGDVLITSSAKKCYDTIPGHALCVAELYDVRPLRRSDAEAACMPAAHCTSNLFAWVFRNFRLIEPFAIKGKLSLWNFTETDKIKVIMPVADFLNLPESEIEKLCEKYWNHLYI